MTTTTLRDVTGQQVPAPRAVDRAPQPLAEAPRRAPTARRDVTQRRRRHNNHHAHHHVVHRRAFHESDETWACQHQQLNAYVTLVTDSCRPSRIEVRPTA